MVSPFRALRHYYIYLLAVRGGRAVALVEFAIADGIAWLTLNRPEKLNVLGRATVAELATRLAELKQRSDVRVVVTRGAGRAYCAGSDLADLAELPPDEAANAERAH